MDQEVQQLQREVKGLRRSLKGLCDDVWRSLDALDAVMSDRKNELRGRRIAQISNFLERNNERVYYTVLRNDFRKERKPLCPRFEVRTLQEAEEWFATFGDGTLLCVRGKGKKERCGSLADAKAFFQA